MTTITYGYDFLLGWLLIKRAHHAWSTNHSSLPILSASSCICDVKPDAYDWYEDDRLAFLHQHEKNAEGNFIFLETLESAVIMNNRWYAGEFEPVALALRPASAAKLDAMLERYMASSNSHNSAYKYTPLEAQAWTQCGQLLGFDVLGYDWGWHSFLCSQLEDILFTEFNGTLSEDGLITDPEIAEQFAEHINTHACGEPGLYLAYAMFAPKEKGTG